MQYELNAETMRYMLGIVHNGVRRELIGTFKRYENGTLIQLLNERERELGIVNSKTDSDALDFKTDPVAEADRKFFDSHLVALTVDGKEASEAVINKLDALYKIRKRFIDVCLLGVGEPQPSGESGELDLDSEFGETIEKPQTFNLVDEAGKEITLDLSHIVRFATAEDRIRWDRSQKVQTFKDGGGRRVRYNYEQIGHLYDSMVKEARGFTLDGQPCTESTKPDWIKRIPYIFKFRAMDSTFDLAQAKNA